jgi:hypothetical protein
VPYITPEGVQALKKVTRRETHQERAANEEIARRSDVEAL